MQGSHKRAFEKILPRVEAWQALARLAASLAALRRIKKECHSRYA